jgi:hypothetical protein
VPGVEARIHQPEGQEDRAEQPRLRAALAGREPAGETRQPQAEHRRPEQQAPVRERQQLEERSPARCAEDAEERRARAEHVELVVLGEVERAPEAGPLVGAERQRRADATGHVGEHTGARPLHGERVREECNRDQRCALVHHHGHARERTGGEQRAQARRAARLARDQERAECEKRQARHRRRIDQEGRVREDRSAERVGEGGGEV